MNPVSGPLRLRLVLVADVAGPRGRYYGYRALASLLRVSLVPSRLTGALRFEPCKGLGPERWSADSLVPCRSGDEIGPEAPVTACERMDC